MRFLRATGWLNFRMRAMVTAVASYSSLVALERTRLRDGLSVYGL